MRCPTVRVLVRAYGTEGDVRPFLALAAGLRAAGHEAPLLLQPDHRARPRDYPDHVHITGAWTLPVGPQWSPPEELDRFLAAGDPPVYVGFGSMGFGADAEARTAAIVGALTRHGRRALLATGWGGLRSSAVSSPGFCGGWVIWLVGVVGGCRGRV